MTRPICKENDCHNFCKTNGKNKFGDYKYSKLCSWHEHKKYSKTKKKKVVSGYRKYKLSNCQFCGFVPIHKCQLDVDHMDGNHSNNDPSNLQTLCSNCHRLKTWQQLHNK